MPASNGIYFCICQCGFLKIYNKIKHLPRMYINVSHLCRFYGVQSSVMINSLIISFPNESVIDNLYRKWQSSEDFIYNVPSSFQSKWTINETNYFQNILNCIKSPYLITIFVKFTWNYPKSFITPYNHS